MCPRAQGNRRGIASMMMAIGEVTRTKMGSKKRARGLEFAREAVDICRDIQDRLYVGNLWKPQLAARYPSLCNDTS